MGRPPKTHLQIVSEKKSHRTKAELDTRAKAENALLTGSSLKEWPDVKANPVSHKEFTRIKKLLKAIKHDDALHEGVINRYCLLLAECREFGDLKVKLIQDINLLQEKFAAGEIEFMDFINTKGNLQDRLMACDRKIMDKRKMMLSIEKENLLTIASALRAIPKKPPDEEEIDPMAALLTRKAGGK